MSEEVKELRNLVAILIERINILTQENTDLRHRLSKYEHPKNSNNSSIPPSKDENRPKRKSLRESSGLKPGGQKGRKGNTLKMVGNPDLIQEHTPHYCNCCGQDLEDIIALPAGRRQVFDIPKIEIKVTEHQIYNKQCKCGHVNQGEYPQQANAPVSYGNNIESLIGYFHTIKPNKIEAEMLTGVQILDEADLKKAVDILHKKGVKQVFISLGERGVFYSSAETQGVVQPPKISIVNATGAGDAFIAALGLGFLKGMSTSETAEIAVAASIIALSHENTINPQMSEETIIEKVKELKLC